MGGVIPEDIMMAARECVRESFADPLSPMQGYVARAILAERQRCADVARSHGGSIRLGGVNAWDGAESIAKDIMNP